MSTLAQRAVSITTSTPISEAIAAPVRIAPLPAPELADLSEPAWQDPVAQQLEEISALEEGWDGSKAGPIQHDVIAFAIHVLQEMMWRKTPAPHVTPMSHEGLMLEWHENSIDLEIEIERPGRLWVSFEDKIENIDEERPLSNDLSMLATPIEKLTKRSLLKG